LAIFFSSGDGNNQWQRFVLQGAANYFETTVFFDFLLFEVI